MKKYFAIILTCIMIVLSVCACSNKDELTPIDVEGQTEAASETVSAPEKINLDAIMETEAVAETESETEPETTAAETKAETKAAKKETKPAKKEEKKETKAETKAETDAEAPSETAAGKPGEENIAVAETNANGYVTAVDESSNETLTPGQTGGPTGSDTSAAPTGGSSTGATSPTGGSDVIYVEKGPGE